MALRATTAACRVEADRQNDARLQPGAPPGSAALLSGASGAPRPRAGRVAAAAGPAADGAWSQGRRPSSAAAAGRCRARGRPGAGPTPGRASLRRPRLRPGSHSAGRRGPARRRGPGAAAGPQWTRLSRSRPSNRQRGSEDQGGGGAAETGVLEAVPCCRFCCWSLATRQRKLVFFKRTHRMIAVEKRPGGEELTRTPSNEFHWV